MSRCTHSGCGAEITWAINLKTEKTVPLVPFEEQYPKAHRYTLKPRSDGRFECERNDSGDYMSHFANCPGANQFGRKKS